MADLQFTPGPWVVYQDDPIIILNSGGSSLGEMSAGDPFISHGEMMANARLAASAPELLAELADARTTLSILRTQVMVEIGRCADPSESRWDGVPEKLKERLNAIDAAIARATGAQS